MNRWQIDEADCFSRMLYNTYFGRLQAFRRRARPHEVDDALLAHAITEDGTEVSLRRLIILDALASLTPAHRRGVVEVSLKGNTAAEEPWILASLRHREVRLHHALRALRNAMTAQGVTN